MADPEVVIIGLLLAAAIGAGAQSLRVPPGRDRAWWSFLGSALLGGLFCFVGLWNLIGIRTARHVSATGVIIQLDQHEGGGSSSDFVVVPSTGQPLKVHCGYTGPRLKDGDAVRVEELTFHNTLLQLQALSGTSPGWKLTEGDGTATSAAALALGAALIFGARVNRLRNPEG